MNNQTQQTRYFNTRTEGVGFVNRIRRVHPKQGAPYLSCTINMMSGLNGEKRSPVNVNIFGQAKEVIEKLLQEQPHLEDTGASFGNGKTPTVTCGFIIGDIESDLYWSERNQKHVPVGKGRLFGINFLNINGQRYYTKPEKSEIQDSVESHVEAQHPVAQPQYQQQQQQPAPQAVQPPPQFQSNPAAAPKQAQAYAPQPQDYQNHQATQAPAVAYPSQEPQQQYSPQPVQQAAQQQAYQGQQYVQHG